MLKRVLAKYRENGCLGVLLPMVARFPGVRAFCLYYVYRLPFSDFQFADIHPDGTRIVLANEVHLNDILAVQDKLDIFQERFRMNHVCLLAYYENEPVAYIWGQQGPKHFEQTYGFEIQVGESQIYTYDSFTRCNWRNKGFLRQLKQQMAIYSENVLEKKEFIMIIEVLNHVSLKANERMGFKRDRLECFVNIFGNTFKFKICDCGN